jgi:Wiskott-Aldrich syndrome protein
MPPRGAGPAPPPGPSRYTPPQYSTAQHSPPHSTLPPTTQSSFVQPLPTPFLSRVGHLASRSVPEPPPASPLPWVPGVQAPLPALTGPKGHPASSPPFLHSRSPRDRASRPAPPLSPPALGPSRLLSLSFLLSPRGLPPPAPPGLPPTSHPPPAHLHPQRACFCPAPPTRPGLKNSSSWKVTARKEVTSVIWPQGWALLSPALLKACPAHLQSTNGVMCTCHPTVHLEP